jgi:hypothetical protein
MATDELNQAQEMPIPFALNVENWKLMIKGILQSDAHKRPTTAEAVASLVKISSNTIGSNVRFLKLLGFLTPESKGSQISLTEDGAKYGHALLIGDEKAQRELLTNTVKIALKPVISFCELHRSSNNLDFDKLFAHIKFLAGVADTEGQPRKTAGNYRTAINTIIEILVYATILDESYLPQNNKSSPPKEISSSVPGNPRAPKITYDIPTRGQRVWTERLFQQIKSVNPPKVDKSFISANVDNNRHEGSILKLGKFLGLCDDEGNRAENYEKLRYFGSEEFGRNLGEVLKSKYSKVLANVNLEEGKWSNLVVAFMKEYDMDERHAEEAANIMLDLCYLAGMNLSSDFSMRGQKSPQTIIRTKSVPKYEGDGGDEPRLKNNASTSAALVSSPSSPATIPQIHNTSFSNSMALNINIQIDARDMQSFTNTLQFIKGLKEIPSANVKEIIVAKELKNSEESELPPN